MAAAAVALLTEVGSTLLEAASPVQHRLDQGPQSLLECVISSSGSIEIASGKALLLTATAGVARSALAETSQIKSASCQVLVPDVSPAKQQCAFAQLASDMPAWESGYAAHPARLEAAISVSMTSGCMLRAAEAFSWKAAAVGDSLSVCAASNAVQIRGLGNNLATFAGVQVAGLRQVQLTGAHVPALQLIWQRLDLQQLREPGKPVQWLLLSKHGATLSDICNRYATIPSVLAYACHSI